MTSINSSRDNVGAQNPPGVLLELIESAGVALNGPSPWDIQVHDTGLYQRILTSGALGFGEAYMDGLWECEQLDELFNRLLSCNTDEKLPVRARLRLYSSALRNSLLNLQSSKHAFQVGERHYDIGNDIFEAMLDPTMSYSCGFWQHADNLDQAQVDKLEMICRKLQLQPGETLLDIGCGWGGLARYAAEKFGVKVTGITISREQQTLAMQHCEGLPVKIELIDYRNLNGKFDKIVSVGMFEHVGPKNYPAYFDTALRTLDDKGLFLLHTIGIYKECNQVNAWIDKYIFPNGRLPSATQLTDELNERFLIEDWHNFGQDYDLTLMAWWNNFDAAWPQLKGKYGDRFYRMWKYYLLSCAGFFRARQGQLWQIVLCKRDRREVYRSVR